MQFIKNLFSKANEVVDATSDGVVSAAKSVDKYAQVVHLAATEAALEASDALTQKYGGEKELLKRVDAHKNLMSKL